MTEPTPPDTVRPMKIWLKVVLGSVTAAVLMGGTVKLDRMLRPAEVLGLAPAVEEPHVVLACAAGDISFVAEYEDADAAAKVDKSFSADCIIVPVGDEGLTIPKRILPKQPKLPGPS